jgi:hypothetical protein
MARAAEIVALRGLGLSLAQVGRVLGGDTSGLETALAGHQAALEARLDETSAVIGRVRDMRAQLARGERIDVTELHEAETVAAFDLPWPWGGERFELRGRRAITFITGPLFSGKTKLALAIAETLAGAVFVGLERPSRPDADAARIETAMAWLAEDGAARSDALAALLAWLESDAPSPLVIDMVEQGLDEATQLALMARLRRRASAARPLFLMTRSTAILDLASVQPDEAIIFCPANHAPPMFVTPCPGAAGYEAVASCLGSPDVRARSEGVVAMRSPAA